MSEQPCVFCERIEAGRWFSTHSTEVVHFEPLNPVTPGHMLFVPKMHVAAASEHWEMSAAAFYAASAWAASQHGPFNLITSGGVAATQTIRHMHVHYVPRRLDDGLLLPWSNQPPPRGDSKRAVASG